MSKKSNEVLPVDYFLGCDVAKRKLDVALINKQGIVLWNDTIANEGTAIAEFWLTLTGALAGESVAGVVESTGTYHQAFAAMSYSLGVPCLVYNPLITKQGIKSSVRGKKTDKTDAIIIARMGLRGEGRLYSPEPYMATRHYARSCQKLSVLNSSFSQYKNHFTELLDGELTDDAKELLKGIQTAIKEARTQIYKDMAASAKGSLFTRLQTIPGVGPFVANSIIGEIQTMERFTNAHSLTAYAGLDPKIFKSGESLNRTGRLTKRGSAYLRRSAFIAANVAKRCDPKFKALYDKKRAEGKPYTVATCVVARKLLSVVRAVWLSGKDYDISQWTDENKT
jgi:transposase